MVFMCSSGNAILILGIAPVVLAMGCMNTPLMFVIGRFVIGFGLATFVCAQHWGSVMFSPRIVCRVNAVAAGWGNLGGAVAQAAMPLTFMMAGAPPSPPPDTPRLSRIT